MPGPRVPGDGDFVHDVKGKINVDLGLYNDLDLPFRGSRAEVVELVDALASGASGRKPVGVRVPPSALERGRHVIVKRARPQFATGPVLIVQGHVCQVALEVRVTSSCTWASSLSRSARLTPLRKSSMRCWSAAPIA